MKLQKAATGILGAFGLKVGGFNPTAFGEAVVPVADVFDQYLAQGELQIQRTALATSLAATNSQDFTVPAGKVWRLIAASFFGSLNAADIAFSSIVAIGLKSPISTVFSVLLEVSPKDPGGAVSRGWATRLRPPIFLPSGWVVTQSLTTSAAITVTSNFQVGIVYQEFDL